MSIELHGTIVDNYWYVLDAFMSMRIIPGINTEYQSYLDGTKTTNGNPNVVNDAMQTFWWCSDFSAVFGFDPSGGLGVRFSDYLRNGSSISIVAVRKPVDVSEPATLAAVGLGLTGLGLARRKKGD